MYPVSSPFSPFPANSAETTPYASKLIKIANRENILTVPLTASSSDAYDFHFPQILKANFGLDLVWKPTEKSTWIADFIKNTLYICYWVYSWRETLAMASLSAGPLSRIQIVSLTILRRLLRGLISRITLFRN